ncbi:MAG: asparagine synthetase B family protein, partial [Lachnoanaerobaculum gingivalis]
LYYIRNGSACYFASEAHVFFRTNIINKEFNEEAIYHYLTFLTTPAPSTFFKNVYKLEAGYYLKISKQGVEKQQYFNISDYINIDNKDSFETAVNITREKLESSMKYRNVADVGVCVALSGGLDSSLNLYYSKDINKNIKAINISYEKTSSFDESVISKRLADEYNIDFIGKKVTDTMFDGLIDKYISFSGGLDRPMGDINEVLVYLLSIVALESKSKVMLVGEGGDELGGYPIYRTMDFINKTFGKFSSFEDIFKFLPNRISRKLNFYNGSLVSNMHIHGFTEREKSNLWVGAKNFNSFKILNDYMTEIRDDLNDSYLRKIINIEYKLRLPELILSRIDYPSMAASVEARSPFMDHELIQYSSSLSFGVKMKNGPKSILKAIASDRLPDYILNHPKIGFGGLLNPFLRYTMPIWFHKELIETKSGLHNLISIDYCKYMYEIHEKKKNMGYQMWILYILSRWFRINFDG